MYLFYTRCNIEASTRIKFQRFGNSPYRNREIGEAFKMKKRSFLMNLVYLVTNTQLPMMINYRRVHLTTKGCVGNIVIKMGDILGININFTSTGIFDFIRLYNRDNLLVYDTGLDSQSFQISSAH